MDVARDRALETKPPFAVVADYQTAGRGRAAGRLWNAAPGASLLFTYVFPVSGYDAVPQALSLRAGVALARTVVELDPAAEPLLRVKWPNDVLVEGKKIAGILAECDGSAVYLGMGVNVSQGGGELPPTATSLGMVCGAAPDRFCLLNTIIAYLKEDIDEGIVAWLSILNEKLYRKGERARFENGAAGSGDFVSGILTGIRADGALLITENGAEEPKAFVNGELSWV
jgi:BirA family biotin operon repressor/biotin-[acetyl-CoA-carboxylase] ligase